jgi:hypothetical protein
MSKDTDKLTATAMDMDTVMSMGVLAKKICTQIKFGFLSFGTG